MNILFAAFLLALTTSIPTGSVVKKKMNNDLNEFELYLVQMEG